MHKSRVGGEKHHLVPCILAVLLIVLSAYALYDLNGHSLDLTDREVRLVVTGSMDAGDTGYEIQTIPINSLVMIEHLDGEGISELEIGDVVAFQNNGKVVVHRLIGYAPDGSLILKGDAILPTDTVDPEDVIGKVVGVSPILGKAVTFAKSSPVLLIGGVLCLFVMIWSIREIIRVLSDKEETS